MLENIALIREVQESLSTSKAQELALQYLKRVRLEKIALLRVSSCSKIEIFYTLLIRALMTKKATIIIVTPFTLMPNLRAINVIIEDIQLLTQDKKIIILDNTTNQTHYKGCSCNITK